MLSAQQIQALESRNRAFERTARRELVSRFDANETLFLERQLTQVRSTVYTVQYADLLGRSMMSNATDIAPFADNYVYGVYDRKGRARIAGNNVKDIPRIDLIANEVTGKVRNVEAAYGWDINSMREAARLGIDLPTMKADAARQAIETSIDEMLATGDLTASTGQSNVGCTGLVNNADVIAQGIITPTTPQLINVATTPAQMIADLNQMATSIVGGSNQKFIPDTFVFAPNEYNILAQTPISNVSDKTVLSWFLANNPYIKYVKQWWRLTNAGVGGTKNRAIVYKNDKLILESVIPLDFESLPPQPELMEFVVPCLARCGGVKIYQSSAVRYADFTP